MDDWSYARAVKNAPNMPNGEPLITATHLSTTSVRTPEEPPNNEYVIWNTLAEYIDNPVMIAAIMGNIKEESNFCPYRWESLDEMQSMKLYEKRITSRENFIYTDKGFGLCCWTGLGNLEQLYDFCTDNRYEVDSIDGQIAFLINDMQENCPKCYKRMLTYDIYDIVTATEDFRQSYEGSVRQYQSQYRRAKNAIYIYIDNSGCDEFTIMELAKVPFDFDIYMKILRMEE